MIKFEISADTPDELAQQVLGLAKLFGRAPIEDVDKSVGQPAPVVTTEATVPEPFTVRHLDNGRAPGPITQEAQEAVKEDDQEAVKEEAQEAPKQEAATAPAPAPEKEDPEKKLVRVRAKLAEARKAGVDVSVLVHAYGHNLTEVDPCHYDELLAAAEKALKEQEAQ